MSSEQYSVSNILSKLRLFEWKFQIPIDYSQNNLVSLSCISVSVEEARQQILSMLSEFENLAEKKNNLEKEKKQKIKHSSSTEYFNHEINYYLEIKKMYQCNITYEIGCRDSSMSPYDYTRNMKVINGHDYIYNTFQLEDLIKIIEPQIKCVNLISFYVGQ
jgi:hypothetical protein